MTDSTKHKLLSRVEAADFLGVTVGTLEVWASTKRYPLPVVKIGRLAKYRLADLHRFIDERTLDMGRADRHRSAGRDAP